VIKDDKLALFLGILIVLAIDGLFIFGLIHFFGPWVLALAVPLYVAFYINKFARS
jgi:hypothetical protein